MAFVFLPTINLINWLIYRFCFYFKTTRLDREQQALHELTILCVDYGTPPMASSMTLVVHVTDINDNIPHFSQSTYLAELYENNNIGDMVTIVYIVNSIKRAICFVNLTVPEKDKAVEQ